MEKDQEINQEANVYEVGFHLAPNIAEDSVPAEFAKIKDVIKAEGGEFISEAAPELTDLAYEIADFDKAYFGWVKFSVSPEAVEKIKKALDASKAIIRYLVTSTVKESTLFADKAVRPSREEGTKEENID